MSYVTNWESRSERPNEKLINSGYWIRKHLKCSVNGLFRVWWKDAIGYHVGGGTFDKSNSNCSIHEDCDGHKRWEWKFKQGNQVGLAKSWWPNGNMNQLRFYNYGKPEGLHRFFSPDGMEWSEVYWYNGKMWSGVQKKWGIEPSTEGKKIAGFDGRLVKEIHYENGMKIKKMKWSDGRLVKEIHYENGIETKVIKW